MKPFNASPEPKPLIGLGLRHSHYTPALSELDINTQVDFVELHAENFFAHGGIAKQLLVDISEKYPVSIHGTSLGLGSALAVPQDTLDSFARVVELSNAKMVSEHLCFNRAKLDGKLVHSGDLLPIAYNDKNLDVVVSNVQQVQDRLQRPILLENLSAYLQAGSIEDKAVDEYSEIEFLIKLCRKAGSGLLLDINNLIVNAINQKSVNIIGDVKIKLAQLPSELIGEIHLAGFSEQSVFGHIVDDHAQAVSDECWSLYKTANDLFGHKPTLIEWDNNLPEWSVLVSQANYARQLIAA